jgi:hypothetical protein
VNILRIIIFLGSAFLFLVSNGFAAELFGQILYRDGRPAREVNVSINGGSARTDRSGFYSINLDPGQYSIRVAGQEKRIFHSRAGTRVDFRISRN